MCVSSENASQFTKRDEAFLVRCTAYIICVCIPTCLSLTCCVSRLKNRLRSLLWLDVSFSFVMERDTHNKLSMNSHNTFIVFKPVPPDPQTSIVGKSICGSTWCRTPEAFLQIKAEGDVICRYTTSQTFRHTSSFNGSSLFS